MVTLNIKIPTKISEVRDFIKSITNKKYKHNKGLFNKIAKEICDELKSGYWNKDISEYMRREFTDYPNGKIYTIVRKHKSQLK